MGNMARDVANMATSKQSKFPTYSLFDIVVVYGVSKRRTGGEV